MRTNMIVKTKQWHDSASGSCPPGIRGSIDVVAQDGSTEFGVTWSIWLMLELSNVLVSDTPYRQACLASCDLSAEIVTRTTFG